MISYIIAGAFLGFLSPALISCFLGRVVVVNGVFGFMLAFAGGVGGHVLHTLLTKKPQWASGTDLLYETCPDELGTGLLCRM